MITVNGLQGEQLTEADLAALDARWISDEYAKGALLRRADAHLGAELMGQQGRTGYYSGILIPYLWPGETQVRDFRLRRDRPDLEQGANGIVKQRRKYLAPPGRGNMLYLPPQAELRHIDDPTLPIVIVEGEFKTLALWRLAWHNRGDSAETPAFLPIGLQGVYNWRGVVGKANDADGNRVDIKGPVPDLGKIPWRDRRVVILFDADVTRNLSVADARQRLTHELEDRGATVAWFKWPDNVPPERKGVDDYLAGFGPERVASMLASAKIVTKRRRAATVEISADWKGLLLYSDAGARPILANAMTALKMAPEWAANFSFNEFSLRVGLARGTPWARHQMDWSDTDDILLAEWLQRQGIRVNVMIANQAVLATARALSFHPVRDYIMPLEWDGKPRIDTWLTDYLGVSDSAYARAVGSKWLVSAIARIMVPGCKVDHCLILEGPQGKGKSTALNILAGDEWFKDAISDLGSKDSAIELQGVWIVEFGELDALVNMRAELSRVKAFLTRKIDQFRPPYGRSTAHFPRQCVFAASTNHTTWNRDESGARRFWPVSCGVIDLEALARDRDQIWAEARVRYESGATWYLPKELISQASEEQEHRFDHDAWDGLIWDWLVGDRAGWVSKGNPIEAYDVSIGDVLKSAIQKKPDAWTQQDKNRVSRVFRVHGLERYRKRLTDADDQPIMRPDGQQEREYRYRWPVADASVPPTSETLQDNP